MVCICPSCFILGFWIKMKLPVLGWSNYTESFIRQAVKEMRGKSAKPKNEELKPLMIGLCIGMNCWVVVGTEQWNMKWRWKSVLTILWSKLEGSSPNLQTKFQCLGRLSMLNTCRMSEVHIDSYGSIVRET